MSNIIAVTNSKGGVGKSTISVHLAAWLAEQGHSVLLADCDAQKSSSEWMAVACPDIKTVRIADADYILEHLRPFSASYDYVIADGPGSQRDITRSLLMVADRALVPCKASMLEVQALVDANSLLLQARGVRNGLPPASIIISMVRKSFKLNAQMDKAASALKLPIATTRWSLRQAYADAAGKTLVWQMGSSVRVAAQEARELFTELFPEAVAKQTVKPQRKARQPRKGKKS